MSAFVAIKYPDAIRLVTDGSAFDHDGVYRAKVAKAWAARRPIAITGRGNAGIVEVLARGIVARADATGSVDEALGLLASMLAGMRKRPDLAAFDMLVAAWSETRGPLLLACGNHAENAGWPPYELHDFGNEALGGPEVPLAEIARFANLHPSHPDFLELHGADFMEAMRRRPTDGTFNPGGVNGWDVPGAYTIGGHCQLTTITPAGVETKTLREWNDRPGQRINPFSDDGSVVPLANARKPNRRERRAEKKRAA